MTISKRTREQIQELMLLREKMRDDRQKEETLVADIERATHEAEEFLLDDLRVVFTYSGGRYRLTHLARLPRL